MTWNFYICKTTHFFLQTKCRPQCRVHFKIIGRPRHFKFKLAWTRISYNFLTYFFFICNKAGGPFQIIKRWDCLFRKKIAYSRYQGSAFCVLYYSLLLCLLLGFTLLIIGSTSFHLPNTYPFVLPVIFVVW